MKINVAALLASQHQMNSVSQREITLANEAALKATAWVNAEGTAPVLPTNDTFYSELLTYTNLTDYANGDIIGYRKIGVSNYTNVEAAYQIQYKSTNTFGNATASITTVLIPSNNTGKNIVSYQIHEDATYLNCAPSYEILAQTAESDIQDLLNKGWVVNSPDYEGLNSSFGAGIHSGHLTLDSIIAVQNAATDILNIENTNLAMWGYSGGSLASGWAAELSASYAPSLKFSATAVGGYVVDLLATIRMTNKSLYSGFIAAGILGLASEYTDMWSLYNEQVVSDKAEKFFNTLKQCLKDYIIAFVGMDIWSFFKDGDEVLDIPFIAKIISDNHLAKVAPQFPMMVYQGLSDAIVNYTTVDDAVKFYCAGGTPVTYYRGKGLQHHDAAPHYEPQVLEFLEAAFNNNGPSTCSVVGVALPTSGANSTSSATSGNSTMTSTSASASTATYNNSTSATGTGNGTSTHTATVTTLETITSCSDHSCTKLTRTATYTTTETITSCSDHECTKTSSGTTEGTSSETSMTTGKSSSMTTAKSSSMTTAKTSSMTTAKTSSMTTAKTSSMTTNTSVAPNAGSKAGFSFVSFVLAYAALLF